ncbi:MAG TPA: SDR family NAD(P)-dependent oxidoreductase [Rhodocyclaceae bacterium]|nr:SDR family NAD(P)-dependent oxidoreductase [Rhodocyclaceae bacterium]
MQDQVMVITGATSGIGLTTARRAAERGARVVLAARNAEALGKITAEMAQAGEGALYSPGADLKERQGYEGHVCESSLYTRLTTAFGR